MRARAATTESISSKKTARGYVADALAHCKDDSSAAQVLLVEWATDDEDLFDMLMRAGAAQLIRSFYNGMRSSAATISEARVIRLSETDVKQRTSARIARREFWERYTLYGHKPLKSATRLELEASVDARREQSRGNLVRADFEARVAQGLTNDTMLVEQKFSSIQLFEMAIQLGAAE